MGFGHRVYKNYDPRAKIVKKIADQVFEITGKEPLIEIAMELERIALSDEYFVKRKVNYFNYRAIISKTIYIQIFQENNQLYLLNNGYKIKIVIQFLYQ